MFLAESDGERIFDKKLSWCRGSTQHATSIEILSSAAHLYKKIAFDKACSWQMTLEVIGMALFDMPYITAY